MAISVNLKEALPTITLVLCTLLVYSKKKSIIQTKGGA